MKLFFHSGVYSCSLVEIIGEFVSIITSFKCNCRRSHDVASRRDRGVWRVFAVMTVGRRMIWIYIRVVGMRWKKRRKLTRCRCCGRGWFESIDIPAAFDACSRREFFPPFLEGIRAFANAVGQVSKAGSPSLIVVLQVFICAEIIFNACYIWRKCS